MQSYNAGPAARRIVSIFDKNYKCYNCDHKNKRLSEIKSHIKTKHADKNYPQTIQHIKMNKEDFRKKICKRYSSDEI